LADESATTTRDITSCSRPQWPVPCDIEISCGRPIEACLAAGCFINGTDLFFSPDGYWSGRGGQTGRWSVSRDVMGRKVLVYGDVAAVVQDDGAPLACP
jgi:hypothetical protein